MAPALDSSACRASSMAVENEVNNNPLFAAAVRAGSVSDGGPAAVAHLAKTAIYIPSPAPTIAPAPNSRAQGVIIIRAIASITYGCQIRPVPNCHIEGAFGAHAFIANVPSSGRRPVSKLANSEKKEQKKWKTTPYKVKY